jgi:hypothetical protein
MSIADSFLTLLRDRRAIKKENRLAVAGYLRKIAACCSVFRDEIAKFHANRSIRCSELDLHFRLEPLRHQVHLVEEYLAQLEQVIGNHVPSETLDDVADLLGHVRYSEFRLVQAALHPEIERRYSSVPHPISWGIYVDTVDIISSGAEDPLLQVSYERFTNLDSISLEDLRVASVESFLSELSRAQARLIVLADVAESGF